MWSKIKKVILFIIIAAVLIVVYSMFFKKTPESGNLVTTTSTTNPTTGATTTSKTQSDMNSKEFGQEFLNLLFSIKSINLDNSIFDNAAFGSLSDSSIILIPDGSQGRPNPFAPIGAENSLTAEAAAYLLDVPVVAPVESN